VTLFQKDFIVYFQNLGVFGPLKCREIYALDKLEKQCGVIEALLEIARAGATVDLHEGDWGH